MKFRQLPLRTTLVLAVAALLAGISLFMFLFFPNRMESLSRHWLQRHAVSVIQVAQHSVKPGLEFDDPQFVKNLLAAVKQAPDVTYAVVRNTDGSILTGLEIQLAPSLAEIGLVPKPEAQVVMQAEQMHAVALVEGGDRVWTLAIGFSLDEYVAETRSNRFTVGIVSLALFLLGLLFSYLVGSSVTKRISETSVKIATVSTDIFAATQEQEAAGTQQAASVQEITQTMQSLADSAKHIADSASEVLKNAERVRETTDLTAARISELSRHANRIAEILEAIRDIADRSDLLALNASLEATRAGEAGRSFTLVAAEMRRLAERVTASVEDVKELVADVRSSGATAVLATDENRKLVESTNESARQITMVTQQQRTATEQMTQTMRDISNVIAQTVAAIQQTRTSAEVLKTEADRLAELVGRSEAIERRG